MPRVRTATVDTHCPLEPSFAYTDEVSVTLRDGRTFTSGPIRFATGHAELPLADAQLREKLFSCVAPGEQALAQRVLDRIERVLA
jgi:aconitate decarboxylase